MATIVCPCWYQYLTVSITAKLITRSDHEEDRYTALWLLFTQPPTVPVVDVFLWMFRSEFKCLYTV